MPFIKLKQAKKTSRYEAVLQTHSAEREREREREGGRSYIQRKKLRAMCTICILEIVIFHIMNFYSS